MRECQTEKLLNEADGLQSKQRQPMRHAITSKCNTEHVA